VAAFGSQSYSDTPGLNSPYQNQIQQNILSVYSASTLSGSTVAGVPQDILHNNLATDINPRPAKRQRTIGEGRATDFNPGGSKFYSPQMTGSELAGSRAAVEVPAAAAANKPKRVRTGCLTCRERHLKCDEGLPHCQNCRKSSRVCKRGVRLNFIDTQVQSPPIIPPTADWAGTCI
jgi:hypothetical protein